MKAALGNSACYCRADIHIIAVSVSASPENRIRVADSIGFAPGDLLAETGRQVTLLRCPGPSRNTSHVRISLRLPDGLAGKIFVDAKPPPILKVRRPHVQGSGNRDS